MMAPTTTGQAARQNPSTWRRGVSEAEGGTVRHVPRIDPGRFQRVHGWLHHLRNRRRNRKWAVRRAR